MTTIVALSSGRPPAAIGVVRVSGPRAMEAATRIAGPLPPARRAALRSLRDAGGAPLDRALVLSFPGPRTATGEDLVEFHCHGGRAVIDAVLAALVAQEGCRPAEPGEFTRRALANGRIDLAEAEGLADLLEAETEMQRVAALAAAEGRVSRQVAAWMESVAILSARIEVAIDYDDEEDAHHGSLVDGVARDAASLGRVIAAAVAGPPVERLRDGIRVVIAGPPNAGKSTLLNLLSEREAAIVSAIAGTTRDVIETPVHRAGVAYVLSDTAGLTETADPVEAVGISRARAVLAAADIVLWLDDETLPPGSAIRVHARADLPGRRHPVAGAVVVRRDDPASIARLWEVIHRRGVALAPSVDTVPWRERHRRLCNEAADLLLGGSDDPLLVAERLRNARGLLARITGQDATESMLDAMFSRFCLGK